MSRPTRVALALGGGGARGYAHIGVIEILEERGYEIVSVAGTSMGAVVGGLYAAGRLDAYTEWVRGLTQRDVLRLLDPALRGPGAIRGDKILARVTELLEGAVIEELSTAFTAVATDLLAGKEVWFQQGPVDAAIRASIALPSFVTPVVLNGRLLADGGLLNPVPVVATAAASADVTLAVTLSEETATGPTPVTASSEPGIAPHVPEEGEVGSRRPAAQRLDRELVRAISGWLAGGRGASPPAAGDEAVGEIEQQLEEQAEEELFGALPPGLRTFDVMQLSLEALQRVVTRYRLAGYPPDLLITVPKAACRTLDFHRAKEMIALGREHARHALDEAPSFPPPR